MRLPVRLLIWVIRGTPLLLQLLIIFYGPGIMGGALAKSMPSGSLLAEAGAFLRDLWNRVPNSRFVAALAAFVVNYACYFSEIYRGGIQSVPVGQHEAGKVLGMTRGQIFRKVILLQVIKRILPPISNEVITLVKDTSLARVIAFYELIWEGERFIKKGMIWPLFYTGVFYLVFSGLLTVLFRYIEKKMEYFR